MAEPTPTPWDYGDYQHGTVDTWVGTGDPPESACIFAGAEYDGYDSVLFWAHGAKSEEEQNANAELVVRAVNAHAALFANLRFALHLLENPSVPPTPAALDNMRAALALATKGPS